MEALMLRSVHTSPCSSVIVEARVCILKEIKPYNNVSSCLIFYEPTVDNSVIIKNVNGNVFFSL